MLFGEPTAVYCENHEEHINTVKNMCDYRRGLDWWMDLMATYTHDSELQVITTPLLIYALQSSLQHTLRLLSLLLDVSW
jgi:hypothetical protein